MADLEKPGVVTQALKGDNIGVAGTNFYIKVMEGTSQFTSPARDGTGDGDDHTHYENNGLLYGSMKVSGAMIANQALGLQALVDAGKNPCSITFDLGSNRQLAMTVLVESIQVAWKRDAPWVGVALKVRMTDTAPGTLEAAIGAV